VNLVGLVLAGCMFRFFALFPPDFSRIRKFFGCLLLFGNSPLLGHFFCFFFVPHSFLALIPLLAQCFFFERVPNSFPAGPCFQPPFFWWGWDGDHRFGHSKTPPGDTWFWVPPPLPLFNFFILGSSGNSQTDGLSSLFKTGLFLPKMLWSTPTLRGGCRGGSPPKWFTGYFFKRGGLPLAPHLGPQVWELEPQVLYFPDTPKSVKFPLPPTISPPPLVPPMFSQNTFSG